MTGRTKRVPAAPQPELAITSGNPRGLSGYRYLLAVAALVLLSSGSMLALIGAGVSSLGHWPATPGAGDVTQPGGAPVTGPDPSVTVEAQPAPPLGTVGGVPLPCDAYQVWQIVG